MGTPSSMMVAICSSTAGYNMGTFTPKGLSVAALHFRMCSRSTSGYMEPEPIRPNPPALLTVEASSQPEHQIMPACTNGYLVPNSRVTLFAVSIWVAKLPGWGLARRLQTLLAEFVDILVDMIGPPLTIFPKFARWCHVRRISS